MCTAVVCTYCRFAVLHLRRRPMIISLQIASCYRKQIGLDLMRTMPTNINFNSTDAEGVRIDFFTIVVFHID